MVVAKKRALSALLFACITTTIISVLLLVLNGTYPDINLFRSGISPFIILFILGMFAADLVFSGKNLAVRFRRFLGKLNTLTIILFLVIAGVV